MATVYGNLRFGIQCANPGGSRRPKFEGTIIGRVTSSADGTPLEGIDVTALDWFDNYADDAHTDSDGFYTLTVGSGGPYHIEFVDRLKKEYVPEYYDKKTLFRAADDVYVVAGGVVTADAALEPAGSIAGRITAQPGEQPVERVWAQACRDDGGIVAEDASDDTGVFAIRGLPAGAYRVRFYDERGRYKTRFHSEKILFEAAERVVVSTVSAVRGIDAVMVPRDRIVRMVTVSALPRVIASIHEDWVAPFYTVDGGRSWRQTSAPWAGAETMPQIALVPRTDPAALARLVVAVSSLIQDEPHADKIGIYRTGDFGGSWAMVDTRPWGFFEWPVQYHHRYYLLWPSATDPLRLYVHQECYVSGPRGGMSLYRTHHRSTDGGITWEQWHGEESLWEEMPSLLTAPDPFDATRTYQIFGYQVGGYRERIVGSIYLYRGGRAIQGGSWESWQEQPCPTSAMQLVGSTRTRGTLLMRCRPGPVPQPRRGRPLGADRCYAGAVASRRPRHAGPHPVGAG